VCTTRRRKNDDEERKEFVYIGYAYALITLLERRKEKGESQDVYT